jgi:ribosomal protein S18 acetylase RimI-like enzyme
VLAGYCPSGPPDPDHWLIVRHGDKDVGCLLITLHPAQAVGELTYMGVVPASRGNGWGIDIARHALWKMHKAGYSRMVVAVDAANEPALRMYAAVGFQAWDQRLVYVKVFAAR